MRSLVREFMTTPMSTPQYFGLRLAANFSSLVRLLVPVMRTWVYCRSSMCFDPSSVQSWIAGALDSAWRAVNQYLTLHRPERREDFWNQWGKTEYWDETPKKPGLAKSDQKAMDRNLVIALHNDGVMLDTTKLSPLVARREGDRPSP